MIITKGKSEYADWKYVYLGKGKKSIPIIQYITTNSTIETFEVSQDHGGNYTEKLLDKVEKITLKGVILDSAISENLEEVIKSVNHPSVPRLINLFAMDYFSQNKFFEENKNSISTSNLKKPYEYFEFDITE